MPQLSLAEVAGIASQLGHRDLQVIPTGSGVYWVCTCSCGFRSTRRRNEAQAAQTAAWHMQKVAHEFVRAANSQGHDANAFLAARSQAS